MHSNSEAVITFACPFRIQSLAVEGGIDSSGKRLMFPVSTVAFLRR